MVHGIDGDAMTYGFSYSKSQHRVTITLDKSGVNLEFIGSETAEFLKALVDAANHEGMLLVDTSNPQPAKFYYVGDE